MILREVLDLHNLTNISALKDDEGVFIPLEVYKLIFIYCAVSDKSLQQTFKAVSYQGCQVSFTRKFCLENCRFSYS